MFKGEIHQLYVKRIAHCAIAHCAATSEIINAEVYKPSEAEYYRSI